MNNGVYFNIICEEICITGGKVIHIDKNVGEIDEVHKIVSENYKKYIGGTWELHILGTPVLQK